MYPQEGSRTILSLPGNVFQRIWQGGPTRKCSRTKLLLPGNAFQRLRPGGSPRWGLPRKGSRTKSFFSEALARGSPRKGSSTSLLFPGNAFQKLWPGGPPRKGSRTRFSLPGKALEQDSYYQEMPSRGSGHGVPQERHQKNIVFTRKCVPEALAGDPAQEKLQNKIVITWKCSFHFISHCLSREHLGRKSLVFHKTFGLDATKANPYFCSHSLAYHRIEVHTTGLRLYGGC